MNSRIFSGVFSTGISYADREREVSGDYARLAFLPFDTLEPSFEQSCPTDLRADIEGDMAAIQAKRGQPYQISSSGQTVVLGHRAHGMAQIEATSGQNRNRGERG